MMKKPLFLFCFLCTSWPISYSWANEESSLINAFHQCRSIASALERLACYDELLAAKPTEQISKPIQPAHSKSARLAFEQEQQRTQASTDFILTDTGGDNPTILITTPAIGIQPPRPILAFSCIDNITRMQLIFNRPLTMPQRRVTLKTEEGEFS